ncbi:MAG: LexA family protein [Methylocystis sp.]
MNPRDEQRAWLTNLLEKSGEAPTSLAMRAGLAPTTLTRFLNNPQHATALSARTISAVEKVTGARFGVNSIGAIRESEAEPFRQDGPDDILNTMVQAVAGRANGLDPWTLNSRAVEAAGYLPGDVLIVDLNADARPGDVVCAQIYEWGRGKAETVFRIWEPPSLVSATHDPRLRKPLMVDHQNVVIRGVVVASVRPRQGR